MKRMNNVKQLIGDNRYFLLCLLLLVASRSSFANWYTVPSGSMQPTIVEGDRILVNKMAYRLELPFTDIPVMKTGEPERGDIVVFESQKADMRLVKRIIGLPGDRVAMHKNRLYLNGDALTYQSTSNQIDFTELLDGIHHQMRIMPAGSNLQSFNEVIVPKGHYLVLGDNRNNSADSRVYGFVPAQELQGKAIRVLFSLNSENFYLPRAKRTFSPLI